MAAKKVKKNLLKTEQSCHNIFDFPDSKYAPRSTNRLFKLSVHALQNRLTSGGADVNMASGQGHDPSYIDPRSGASTSMSSAHGLYIDPNVRAQTAEANQRRSRISPRSAGFVGYVMNVIQYKCRIFCSQTF